MSRSGKVQSAGAFHEGLRPECERGSAEGAVNAVCERFLGGVRRECLDHVVILGEEHLRSVLRRYTEQYFNTGRPHQGIGQRIPSGRRVALSDTAGMIVAFPVLNGLHHDYRRVA